MSWSTLAAALAVVPISFAIAWCLVGLGVAFAIRRMKRWNGLPWTERARRIYPARHAAKMNAMWASIAVGLIIIGGGVPPLGAFRPAAPWAVAGAMAALCGGIEAAVRLERRVCRPVANQPRAGIALRGFFLMVTLLPMAVTLALIPPQWGWKAAAVLALGGALVTFQNLGGWLSLIRRYGLAWPASERLAAVVAQAVDRTGVRPRRTLELASPHANALALPMTRTLVFTRPMLAHLDDEELLTVAVHELGHLAEPRLVLVVRVASSYVLVACVASIPLGGTYGLPATLAPLAVFFGGMYLLKAVGRRMEERSDRMGRAHEGDLEGRYARALEKIYEANLVPAVLRGNQVHPNLYDRMVATGVTPAYARPAPPPRAWFSQAIPYLLMLGAMMFAMGKSALMTVGMHVGTPRHSMAESMAERAASLRSRGELEGAAFLLLHAASLEPDAPAYAQSLAQVLIKLKRYEEAEVALDQMKTAVASHPYGGAYWRRRHAQLSAELARVRESPAVREE